MKRIIFNVFCNATYQSYLDVNDDFCHNNKTLDDLENGVPVVDFGSISGGDTSVDEEVEDNVIEF